jgi:hypothetical protein
MRLTKSNQIVGAHVIPERRGLPAVPISVFGKDGSPGEERSSDVLAGLRLLPGAMVRVN